MVMKQSGSECDNMKITTISKAASLVISSVMIQAAVAGHAVGIGVGPHFGGGGFGGGVLAAGHVGGGVGSRGGGVGFGGAHFSGGVPNFAGAGSRFSSFGKPSFRQPANEGRPNRSVTPNIAPNGRAMPSAERPSQTVPQRGVNGRIDHHIAERHDTNWHNDWDRRHAHFDHGPDSLPYNNNAYNIDPADSATIQAVQRDLLNLGYYNGSIDGVFGPATRDAVAKYQIAKQLNVTGSLSPDTLQSLNLPQGTAS